MTKRIFKAIAAVTLAALLFSLLVVGGALYGYFSRVQQSRLRALTGLAAQGVANEGEGYLQGLTTDGYRLTWIAADGKVLYDTQQDAAAMENHLERAEVKQAMASGYGESVRYSSTLTTNLLYAAQRLPDGGVLRLAYTQSTVMALTLGTLPYIALIAALAALMALWLARKLSKSIVKPLNALNLDDPLANEGYDELSPLLRRIDGQQKQLKAQADALKRQREEFEAVTGSMNEGLVLINRKGRVLSINQAAAKLFGADRQSVGQDMLTLNRTMEMQALLQKAQNGEKAEMTLPLAGGRYQLDASPVTTVDGVGGVALLIFDVTQRENAEQMRREFTANVSHELKTPLHSISGCAELINNDMVKPEDVKRFTGQIYSEAQRMIRLVEDIIRLSQLDEGGESGKRESVELYALTRDVVDSLEPEADKAQVKLCCQGQAAMVDGVAPLIQSIVFNLCDNAIKYNRPGGSVTVTVDGGEAGATLTVADTGVGIPVEYQSRVFERFFRVDKSRSREVGGTGLGLSIVKHAARVNNAKVMLQSAPGKGTTVTVRF